MIDLHGWKDHGIYIYATNTRVGVPIEVQYE